MDENEVKNETLKHIKKVAYFLNKVNNELILRRRKHDQSKFSDEELPIFIEFTPKLRETTYGSDEYKEFLTKMKPALDHHYSSNRHHPEHFESINKMNLIDIIEMLCDWTAATERHADGDIMKSIEINQKRFGYSDELKNILINTVEFLKEKK